MASKPGQKKSDEDRPIIVVKKVYKKAEEDAGGSWKIAYADFVTAMMAFFLLMWLLGSSSQGDLKGISEYFRNPLKVTMLGGPSSGNSSNVIPGGGSNMEETYGQEQKGDTDKKRIQMSAEEALATAERRMEVQSLDKLKEKIIQQIEQDPNLQKLKHQVKMTVTNEGLEIQIVDEENRPMFKVGKADPLPHMVSILATISSVIEGVPNRVSVTGHTDSSPFPKAMNYTNWELSADRANAARATLEAFGMSPSKVLKVSGLADVVPLSEDPTAAANRRISIVLLNKRAENELLRKEEPELDSGISSPASDGSPQDSIGNQGLSQDNAGETRKGSDFSRPWL